MGAFGVKSKRVKHVVAPAGASRGQLEDDAGSPLAPKFLPLSPTTKQAPLKF